jgi:hypothetical protein
MATYSSEYNKKWRKTHSNYMKEYRKLHRDKINKDSAIRERGYRMNIKKNVVNHYSKGQMKCSCGFSDIRALSIDHINGNGAEERKNLFGKNNRQSSNRFYRWLIKQNYPEGYQVLCANCQMIKRAESDRESGRKYPHELLA